MKRIRKDGTVVSMWVSMDEKAAYERVAKHLHMTQSEVARLYSLRQVVERDKEIRGDG